MIKISACVIVKNEAENLPKWLECMQKVADEIIVVDTGSTDNSVELAKAAGAKVYYFNWINDFAAAKNFALEKATGNWIIFNDADETFTAETINNVRSLIKKYMPRTKVVAFCCRLRNIEKEFPYRVRSYSLQVRIFRKQPNLHYEGRIHEALNFTKQYTVELTKEIEINHTGYSSGIIPDKLQRNLKLLKETIEANNGKITPLKHRYLMDCYYGLKEYEKAIDHGLQAISNVTNKINSIKYSNNVHIYATLCSAYQLAKRSQKEIIELMDKAIVELSNEAEIYLMYGLLQYKYHNYMQSEKLLTDGLKLQSSRPLSLVTLESESDKYLPLTYSCLAKINKNKFNYIKAESYLQKALRIVKSDIKILQFALKIWRKLDLCDADIITKLNKIYIKDVEQEMLVCELRELAEYKIALYFAKKIKKITLLSPLQRYLVANRYDVVAEKTSEILVGLDEIKVVLEDKTQTEARSKERYKQMKSEIAKLVKL